MDLLAFERKLDQTIARKRMEIQEAIKKPLTVRRAGGEVLPATSVGIPWPLGALVQIACAALLIALALGKKGLGQQVELGNCVITPFRCSPN